MIRKINERRVHFSEENVQALEALRNLVFWEM
jgi:hypothetical protein